MQTATADTTPTPARRKKICGVYAWEHTPTGMSYIGSSTDCERRRKRHMLSGGHFHRRATELGWENFTFRILKECLPELRLELERDWIQKMNSVHPHGFNIQKDPTKGWNYVFTDEMRKALSAIHSTPEARAAQSRLMKLAMGTPEARAAASARVKFRLSTPEARAELSARQKRILGTPEARAANSARKIAHFRDPQVRDFHLSKLKLAMSTPEARAAASVKQKITKSTPEFRAAQSLQLKIILGKPEARAANSLRQKEYYATHKSHRCKKVNQYTKEGELVATFESVTIAAKIVGSTQSSISTSIKRCRACGGFYWKFAC